jgi:hypothetical protein
MSENKSAISDGLSERKNIQSPVPAQNRPGPDQKPPKSVEKVKRDGKTFTIK